MGVDRGVSVPRKITIRDSTLREGLDVPHVRFSTEQKLRIAKGLDRAKVPELEIVAPGNVLEDLRFARRLKEEGLRITTSGLLYSFSPRCREEIVEAGRVLDRVDLLMPVSERRRPYDRSAKKTLLLEVLEYCLKHQSDVGVGFPHSTQAEPAFLSEISREAVKGGAGRVVVYDTNGSADPFEVHDLIKRLKEGLEPPLFFH